MRLRLALILLCSCIAPAMAQVGSVSAARSDVPSHAWAAVERDDGVLIVHVPPRDSDGISEPADPGSVRPVRPIKEMPDAIAGVGDRAYLFFPPSGTPQGPIRRVLSFRSVPAGLAGMWTDVPHGLLDPMPPLRARGRLIDVAADPAGVLYALTRGPGEIQLWAMHDDEWHGVELPETLPQTEPLAIAMLSFGEGVLLAERDADRTRAWTRDAAGVWASFELDDWSRFWQATWRRGMGQEVVVGVPGESPDQPAAVWSLAPGRETKLGNVEATPGGATVLLPSSGRLVALRPSEEGMTLQELSLVSGRVIFEGEAPSTVPLPVGEFRLIVLTVLLVMSAALFVIIKPGEERPWTVPDGWVLADPGRRLLATLFDVVLTASIVAPVFGVSTRQLLIGEVLVHGGHAWVALPTLAVSGWIAMSVWESLLGLTPGKFVMGLRVYRATAGPARRVPIFWCLVRNGVKWLVFPAAMLALADPQGRHRGDAAAGAAVVSGEPPTRDA